MIVGDLSIEVEESDVVVEGVGIECMADESVDAIHKCVCIFHVSEEVSHHDYEETRIVVGKSVMDAMGCRENCSVAYQSSTAKMTRAECCVFITCQPQRNDVFKVLN